MFVKIYRSAITYPLACIIIFLLFLIACNKTNRNQTLHLPDQLSMPAGKTQPESIKDVFGIRMTGSITIYHTSNGEVLISFNDRGKSETHFILQTEQRGQALARIEKIELAELLYLKNILLLNDLNTGQLRQYWVNSEDYETVSGIIPRELKNKIRENIYGIGLSYHKGVFNNLNEQIDLNESIYQTLYPHNHTNKTSLADPSGTECISGGVGSSSCSTNCGENAAPASCTVTCNSGYYACCMCLGVKGVYGASCKCIKNPIAP